MSSIQSATYSVAPMDKSSNAVVFTFTTIFGDVVNDGPRILPIATDLVAASTTYGNLMLTMLAQNEINLWSTTNQTGGTLKYAVATDLLAAMRYLYQTSKGAQLYFIAYLLWAYYQSGIFTQAQMMGAFGANAIQWTTLQTNISNFNSAYNTMNAAAGS